MLDRDSELDAFKQVSLVTIAASFGFEVVKRKSTRSSVLMSNGSEKIIVAKRGRHYVYCSVSDSGSNGTAIDFVANHVERGASLGKIRQVLRPFLSSGYVAAVEQKYAKGVVKGLSPSRVDLTGVAARFSGFDPIVGRHRFLCDTRGVPEDVLTSKRFLGRLRASKQGAVIFPHYGSPDGQSTKRCLTGYEIKGQGVAMFSKGGLKGLAASAAFPDDNQIAFCEGGLDMISYIAHRGDHGTRVFSTAGRMNPTQPALIQAAIKHLGEGTVIAAFDNDRAGDDLTQQLEEIVRDASRNNFEFCDDRHPRRGCDWNDAVMETAQTRGLTSHPELSLGR